MFIAGQGGVELPYGFFCARRPGVRREHSGHRECDHARDGPRNWDLRDQVRGTRVRAGLYRPPLMHGLLERFSARGRLESRLLCGRKVLADRVSCHLQPPAPMFSIPYPALMSRAY